MIRFSQFLLVIMSFATLPSASYAETIGDFLARAANAYAASDRHTALRDLFFMEGMDAETVEMYDNRIIGRMLGKHDAPSLAVEPLPADFDPVQVGGGYVYRPNLTPLGYLVIGGNTRAVYGRHGGNYYLVGIVRTPIENPVGEERMLQMMAMGMAHPPLKFDGYCEVVLANGDRKRVPLQDEGLTSKTMMVTGVSIEACKLRNLSGRGSLMLQLLEGDETIFNRQIDSPDNTIIFAR